MPLQVLLSRRWCDRALGYGFAYGEADGGNAFIGNKYFFFTNWDDDITYQECGRGSNCVRKVGPGGSVRKKFFAV